MNRLFASRRTLPLQILFWVLPLAAVIWWAVHQKQPELPQTFGAVMWLVGGTALYAVATLLRAERWQRILDRGGARVPRAETYALVPVGYMGNNVLPARGGEMLRVFLLGASTREHLSRKTILGTIVAERLLDAVALALILGAVAYDLLSKLSLPSGRTLVLGGAVLLAFLVLLSVAAVRFDHYVARGLHALKAILAPSRDLASPAGVWLLLLSIFIWVLEAAVYIAVGEALSLHLGLTGGLSVVAFTNVAALVPAAPGYLGTYDAAVIFAVKAVTGVASGSGIVTSYLIVLRFVLFVPITLVGFIVMLTRYGGLARLRAARRAEATAEARAA